MFRIPSDQASERLCVTKGVAEAVAPAGRGSEEKKDRPDLLRDITDDCSKARINFLRASIVTVRDQVRNRFRVQVSDLGQLETTFAHMKKVKGINSVPRRQSWA